MFKVLEQQKRLESPMNRVILISHVFKSKFEYYTNTIMRYINFGLISFVCH